MTKEMHDDSEMVDVLSNCYAIYMIKISCTFWVKFLHWLKLELQILSCIHLKLHCFLIRSADVESM